MSERDGNPEALLGILEDIFRPDVCLSDQACIGSQPGKRRTETRRLLAELRAIHAKRSAGRAALIIIEKLRNWRGHGRLSGLMGLSELRNQVAIHIIVICGCHCKAMHSCHVTRGTTSTTSLGRPDLRRRRPPRLH